MHFLKGSFNDNSPTDDFILELSKKKVRNNGELLFS
jgi:hypothetical protein